MARLLPLVSRPYKGRRTPLLLAGSMVGLAAASLLLPWSPSFDPWGWILWGRQITHASLIFSTSGYPSWKPLPVALTSLFSLAGSLAPSLWLVFARAAALAALCLAYSLASRLAGRMAGALAVAGVALLPGWVTDVAGGASEPLLAALMLGAVERHVARRRGQALGLLFAASLLRPEAWLFLVVYAAFYAGRDPRRWLGLVPLLGAVPAAWLGPEWIGAGDPLHGSHLAQASSEASQTRALGRPLLGVTWAGLKLVILPLWLGGVVAVLRSLRAGEQLPAMLAVTALAWIATVVLMATVGYAGIPRFMVPAGAMVCVAGGIGLAWVVRDLGAGHAAVAVVLALAVVVPFALPRARALGVQVRTAQLHHGLQRELGILVERLGGRAGVRACGRVLIENQFRGALAWKLGVPEAFLSGARPRLYLRRRGRRLRRFPPSGRAVSLLEVADAGPWKALWRPPPNRGASAPCAEAAARPGPPLGSR